MPPVITTRSKSPRNLPCKSPPLQKPIKNKSKNIKDSNAVVLGPGDFDCTPSERQIIRNCYEHAEDDPPLIFIWHDNLFRLKAQLILFIVICQ